MDEHEASERLLASPKLLKAWHSFSSRESAYAWHLLNRSWQIPPSIPSDYIPHNPRLRFWDNAGGWSDHQPCTLTVFRGLDEPTRCRLATWHRGAEELWRQLIQFVKAEGDVPFSEPKIAVEDADVPFAQLHEHLQAIAACSVPAISLQDPHEHSVTTDLGSVGFEYFSQNQPPAAFKFEWSDYRPREWEPLLEQVERLRTFLMGCLRPRADGC